MPRRPQGPRAARHACVVFVLIAALAAAGVGAGQEKSVNDGVYTEAQAARGKSAFEGSCTSCHDTSRFIGDGFIDGWASQPVAALFDVMRTTMPEDSPGSLKPQQYADVLSFILSLNGFPTGQEELKAADEAMKAVRMEKVRK